MAFKNQKKEIFVFADWQGIKQPTLMGTLHVTPSRGAEVFAFEYSKEWLNLGLAQHLDPDLGFYPGPQYIKEDKKNFGIFLDSSPDRWGKALMNKRERLLAKLEDRAPVTLLESDYLLGVYDGHRMGALRFKTEMDGPFLDENKKNPVPQWATLRELEHASLELEKDDIIGDPDYVKWLNMLVAPGGSLGGARPKSSIVDPRKKLWIAKFPSRNDNKDIGAWEMVVHDLAIAVGINMTESQVKKFNTKHHTFLTKRFDRTDKQERIHFASAMTLLGKTDGADYTAGVSYLDLVEFLVQNGARTNEDLLELWKRIVFNICVTNTDDHLRNHGFLLTDQGWVLSPAYDINPIADGTALTLNISEDDNSLDFDLAISVAKHFRIKDTDAEKIVKEIKEVVSLWRTVAQKYGISRGEQDEMATAFRI